LWGCGDVGKSFSATHYFFSLGGGNCPPCPPPMTPLAWLGITVRHTLTFHHHISVFVTKRARSVYALKTTRAHGLNGNAALWNVTHATMVSHPAPSRRGYRRYTVPGPITRRGAHENMCRKNFWGFFTFAWLNLYGTVWVAQTLTCTGDFLTSRRHWSHLLHAGHPWWGYLEADERNRLQFIIAKAIWYIQFSPAPSALWTT